MIARTKSHCALWVNSYWRCQAFTLTVAMIAIWPSMQFHGRCLLTDCSCNVI